MYEVNYNGRTSYWAVIKSPFATAVTALRDDAVLVICLSVCLLISVCFFVCLSSKRVQKNASFSKTKLRAMVSIDD